MATAAGDEGLSHEFQGALFRHAILDDLDGTDGGTLSGRAHDGTSERETQHTKRHIVDIDVAHVSAGVEGGDHGGIVGQVSRATEGRSEHMTLRSDEKGKGPGAGATHDQLQRGYVVEVLRAIREDLRHARLESRHTGRFELTRDDGIEGHTQGQEGKQRHAASPGYEAPAGACQQRRVANHRLLLDGVGCGVVLRV